MRIQDDYQWCVFNVRSCLVYERNKVPFIFPIEVKTGVGILDEFSHKVLRRVRFMRIQDHYQWCVFNVRSCLYMNEIRYLLFSFNW